MLMRFGLVVILVPLLALRVSVLVCPCLRFEAVILLNCRLAPCAVAIKTPYLVVSLVIVVPLMNADDTTGRECYFVNLPKQSQPLRVSVWLRNGCHLTFGDRFTQIQDQMRDHGPGCNFI